MALSASIQNKLKLADGLSSIKVNLEQNDIATENDEKVSLEPKFERKKTKKLPPIKNLRSIMIEAVK